MYGKSNTLIKYFILNFLAAHFGTACIMRAGKKPNSVNVNTKPIVLRNCAVRVEKVKKPFAPPAISQPAAVNTSSKINSTVQMQQRSTMSGNWRTSTPQMSEEKKFRGPFKKRPISEESTASSIKSTPTAVVTAERDVGVKAQKPAVVLVQKQQHPTIAAGRSRRAIKPNPKYASEDLVTSRIIKNVAASAATDLKRIYNEKTSCGRSGSSIEEFFSRESSDEIGVDADLVGIMDKALNDSDKEFNSDYEAAAMTNVAVTIPRRRGRPRREVRPMVKLPVERITGSSTTTVTSSMTVKEHNTQFCVGRKDLISASSMSHKRKTITDKEGDSEYFVTRKRYLISTAAQKYRALEDEEPNMFPHLTTPKQAHVVIAASEPALNGSRVAKRNLSLDEVNDDTEDFGKSYADDEDDVVYKSQSPLQIKKIESLKTNLKSISKTSNLVPRTRSQQKTTTKLRSVSPAVVNKISKDRYHNDKTAGKANIISGTSSLAAASDNFETMPTFTIVNINDIISKKGDALISKTTSPNSGVPRSTVNTRSNSIHSSTTTAVSEAAERKPTTDHIDAQRLLRKTFASTSKPPQTILNHQLANRAMARQLTTPVLYTSKNSAPRILNAMVAKKTQPVKPMTANPDDSADESFTLSLDDDDDVEDNPKDNDVLDVTGETHLPEHDVSADDEYNSSSNSVVQKRKVSARNIATLSRSTASGKRLVNKMSPTNSKENSLSAINRQHSYEKVPPTQLPLRRLSPEKVEISRQGDKIIKKITCLENWYVMRDKKLLAPKAPRNTLEMALIDLANVAVRLSLPSSQWSSKVTLYELPAAMLAKATLTTFIGSLSEHHIAEEDRTKYQPSCVMFRRAVSQREKSRLPYDRAVIFKNNTFFTNIEGKNIRLVAAPTAVHNSQDVEILLQIVDTLSLQSTHVELATTTQ